MRNRFLLAALCLVSCVLPHAASSAIFDFSASCTQNCGTGLSEYGTISAITGYYESTSNWSFTFGNRVVNNSTPLSYSVFAVGPVEGNEHPFPTDDEGNILPGSGIRVDPTNFTERGGKDVISISEQGVQIQFSPFGQGAETMFATGSWTRRPDPISSNVSVTTIGQGSVTSSPAGISCGSWTTCEHVFTDASITLTASPASEWRLVEWQEDCQSYEGLVCNLVLGQDRNVTAEFELDLFADDDAYDAEKVGDKLVVDTAASGLASILVGDRVYQSATIHITQYPGISGASLMLSPDNSGHFRYEVDQSSAFGQLQDTFTYRLEATVDGIPYTSFSGTVTIRFPYDDVDGLAQDDEYPFDGTGDLVVHASNGVLVNDDGGLSNVATKEFNPSFGTVSVDPDGGFRYHPNGSFTPDFFEYRILRQDGKSDVATVRIAQQPVEYEYSDEERKNLRKIAVGSSFIGSAAAVGAAIVVGGYLAAGAAIVYVVADVVDTYYDLSCEPGPPATDALSVAVYAPDIYDTLSKGSKLKKFVGFFSILTSAAGDYSASLYCQKKSAGGGSPPPPGRSSNASTSGYPPPVDYTQLATPSDFVFEGSGLTTSPHVDQEAAVLTAQFRMVEALQETGNALSRIAAAQTAGDQTWVELQRGAYSFWLGRYLEQSAATADALDDLVDLYEADGGHPPTMTRALLEDLKQDVLQGPLSQEEIDVFNTLNAPPGSPYNEAGIKDIVGDWNTGDVVIAGIDDDPFGALRQYAELLRGNLDIDVEAFQQARAALPAVIVMLLAEQDVSEMPPDPDPDPDLPSELTVFATDQQYTPDFGGLAGGDGICQSAATAANLSGVYKAWLSSSASSAAGRFAKDGSSGSTVPYCLPSGCQGGTVASNFNQLVSAPLLTPILETADGQPHPGPYDVWTGTTQSGGKSGSLQCANWTSQDCADSGLLGALNSNDAWSDAQSFQCCATALLLCVQQYE